jgi:hypothetical protein
MAINFPDSPIINQIFVDSTSGFYYQWDGTVWKSYSASSTSNIKIIDDISGSFNGSTQTFALTISTVSFSPVNAQQLIVVLGGIVQAPTTDYTISGSNITFTTAPIFGLTCSIVSIGSALPQSAIEDGTVTPSKLSTGGPSWNTGGDVYISGVTTITNASGTVIAGIGTTALIVNGNARVTGILTIGTSSITLNGSEDQVNVGSATTIHTGGFRIGSSDLHSTGITVTNANILGVVTASSFSGPVSGNATGLTGTPDIDVRNITGVAATFTGNVSIAGTLTYEDVTNVDSVGLITARSGIQVTGGSVVVGTAVTLSSGGVLAGVVTASSFVGNVTGNATGLTGTPNINVGAVTATSAVVGSAVTVNSSGINVAGIVTATSFRGDGSQLTGVGGAAAVTVLTSNTTLSKGTAYMLNASGLVLTLPASPSTGDAIDILNNVSGIHTLARNGSSIMSISEDMEFGERGLKFKVWYTGSTWSLF